MEDLAGKLGFVRTFLYFFLFLIFSSSVSLVFLSGVLVVTLCRLKKVYKGGQFVNRPLTNITLTRIVIHEGHSLAYTSKSIIFNCSFKR